MATRSSPQPKARVMDAMRETPATIITVPSNDTISGLATKSRARVPTSPGRPKDLTHRFALLSPPSEYDLRSLPPTPQDSSPASVEPHSRLPAGLRTDKPQPPPPLTLSPATSTSSLAAVAFPTHRRKTSSSSPQSGGFTRSSVASTLSYSSSNGSSMPPSLPARSPLRRPVAKSTASFTGVLKDYDLAPDSPLPLSPNSMSFYAMGGLDSNLVASTDAIQILPSSKATPRRPSDASEVSLSAQTLNPSLTSFAPTITPTVNLTSASSPNLPSQPSASTTSKRSHGLMELLSSERAYAADLAVVRDIHMPLSRGQPVAFDLGSSSHHPSSLASSPRSSTHTTSTASSSRTASTAASSVVPPVLGELPMTAEASKIIFGNIDEIALFADQFTDRLEAALGNVLPGGTGEDRVGELFLRMIPIMAPIYKTYITRHPTAIAQFQALPPSPALTSYLNTTRALTTSHTHAWDIPSLLIKPVQRLLKYPLLLSTIYAETPSDHPDKATLLEAKEKLEEVARMVNEGRRRWEVVKTLLGQNIAHSEANGPAGVSGSGPRGQPPRMGRMKSFKSKIKAGIVEMGDLNQGKEELDRWERRIKECEMVTKDFARHALEWNHEVHISLKRLRGWNTAFGDVVGLGEQGVEAVGAFGKVVAGLLALWKELDAMISDILLKQLSNLLRTLSSPRILLTHMHTLRHSHITLLNTPYNKSRPPSALMEASNDYLALQATLREELPAYISLFEKGLGVILLEFSKWQKGYWRELRDRWISFWVALAAETEGDEAGAIAGIGDGASETVRIWWERFGELETIVNGFEITNKRGISRPTRTPEDPQTTLYRQPNTSSTSIRDPSTKVYQKSTHSRSANEILSTPIWDLDADGERTPGYFTPQRGRHKRKDSETVPPLPVLPQPSRSTGAQRELTHVAPASFVPGPPLMPTLVPKRERSKGRESEPKSPKSSRKPSKEPRNRTRVPRLVEPFAQNLDVTQRFAAPLSPKDRDKIYGKERRESETAVTLSGSSTASSGVFKRRLTDALFGLPRTTGGKHGRSKSLSSEADTSLGGSTAPPSMKDRKSSDFLSVASGSNSQRSSLNPLPSPPAPSDSLEAPSPSFSSQMNRRSSPLPSQLDAPGSPLYCCTTIVPFLPPSKVSYMSLPFLTLHVGDTIQVLYEAGHPSDHVLPIYVDEGEDCLLVARDESGRVGWVFASFVMPVA